MLKINELARLHLGVKGENLSRTIEIDMSAWAQTYPNATAEILHKRQGDQTKALTGATYDSETMLLSWTPTDYDTFYEGYGTAEIRMMEGEVVKKTKDLIVTAVCPSVIDGSGSVVASDYQAFLNSVIGYKADAVAAKNGAEDAAEDAADSATDAAASAEAAAASAALVDHYPIVNEATGKWAIWHIDHYVDTDQDATGPTPDIEIGTVTTLAPDQSAYVQLDPSSTPEEPIFNFGLPKGEAGSVDNIYGSTIEMSSVDSTKVATAIGAKADKVSGAVNGNLAGLDANGNLTDSGIKASDKVDVYQGTGYSGKFMKVGSDGNLVPDAVPDPTGKADKVSGAVNGNLAGLDANGNLTDSGIKASDKVDVYQGTGNAGKALGIGNDGNVVPVPFSGDDFTGATASTAGVHGYVPAPAAGDQDKVLTGGGTWEISPGAKILTVDLDTITNVSGSYTATTIDARISSDMKPVSIFFGDPSVIRAKQTVTCNNGSITFTCSSVVGTTTAKVFVQKVIDDPTAVTSSEYDLLNNRIGDLTSLTTTANTNAVAAINEVDSDVGTVSTNLGSPSSASSVTGADAFTKINTLNTNLGSPTSASGVTGADAFAKIDSLNSNLITGPGDIIIPNGSDLNSCKNRGTYTISTDASAGTISNIPVVASGRLIVIGRPYDTYIIQVYIPSSNAVILYGRNYNNGTWTEWKLMNTDAALGIHTGTVTTSSSGTASFNITYNTNQYMCLSVVTTAAVSGMILLPYKYGDAANGRWGLQAISSGSLQPIANTSVSYVAVIYKYA